MSNITSVITNNVYPIIKQSLAKNTENLKKCIGRFITNRHNSIYDSCPCDRIYFGDNERNDFFRSIEVTEKEITNEIVNAFWWGKRHNPPQIKDPFTVAVLCCIRYFLIEKDEKSQEITTIYLAFSGKFYASLHGKFFKKFPPSEKREVMEYTINNKLSDKFDIKREGNVFGAIRNLCITWLKKYGDLIKSKDFDDEEAGDVIQQLRDREKSFIKNISKKYYEAYENKEYLNYESDDFTEDNYRVADNDSLRANRLTEKALFYITQNSVDFGICTSCSDQNVSATEIKNIMEVILSTNDHLDEMRDVINVLITDFMKNNKGKSIPSVDFVTYSITPKPNIKDPNIIRMKSTILKWLEESSPEYLRRRKRPETNISYQKSILCYFVLIINKSAKE